MARKQYASLGAALCVAGALGSVTVEAQEREIAPTVILACDHSGRGGSAAPWTRVSGIETAGRVPTGLAAALRSAPPCAEAFNLLANGGFDLVHRLAVAAGDVNGDGDVDGRDFLVWQRGGSPAPARPTGRGTTVGLKCNYAVGSGPLTQILGSEFAGSVGTSLAGVLVPGQSCAEAYAALAGAGFDLASAAPAPAASNVDAADYVVWRKTLGAGG